MKKASTLVEVLVSFLIFTFSIAVILTTYVVVNRIKAQEIDYFYFESICLDIDKYYTKYNSSETDWASHYFSDIENTKFYFDKKYEVTSEESGIYSLEYKYVNGELIINIKNINNDQYIIKDLNYGGLR